MEQIGNTLVYFAKYGWLPWYYVTGYSTKLERNRKIREKMIETTCKDMCVGLPNVFSNYMEYCRGMNFEDEPTYEFWVNNFAQVVQDIDSGEYGLDGITPLIDPNI